MWLNKFYAFSLILQLLSPNRRELISQHVNVSIIEPGAFSTGIIHNTSNVGLIKANFEKQSPEIREYYGHDYIDRVQQKMPDFNALTSKNVHKVVDAYVDALTSRFPKVRYVVGFDAIMLTRFVWMVPECIVDYGQSRVLKVPVGPRRKP